MIPFVSTSVETDAIKRVQRVLSRLTKVARMIERGGVYNCRAIAGSSTYSQHSWGNAVDLFPHDTDDLPTIAGAVVRLATRRERANRFRVLPVSQVIVRDRIWTPAEGWHAFTGTYHGTHVHVSGSPLREGRPPCA